MAASGVCHRCLSWLSYHISLFHYLRLPGAWRTWELLLNDDFNIFTTYSFRWPNCTLDVAEYAKETFRWPVILMKTLHFVATVLYSFLIAKQLWFEVTLLSVFFQSLSFPSKYLCVSDMFHSILLNVSVIACESGFRSSVPLPHTTRVDSTKGFKFPWTPDFSHVWYVTWKT